MKSYITAKVGQHRGRPRLWVQGMSPAKAGFTPGVRYNITPDREKRTLLLEVVSNGVRVVSRKTQGDREVPVIDINSAELLSLFEGMDTVRLVMRSGRIYILPAASELAAQERSNRLQSKLKGSEPISVGSLSHGGGVLSHALHAGLAGAGIPSRLAFANDLREELLAQADACNDAWDDETVTLATPMQELALDAYAMAKLPRVEILEMGLPCSGASVAGKAKRSLGHAEEHPEVGHLVVSALAIINKVQPAIIVLENVKQYLATASMWILRHQLRDMGYTVHETLLHAGEWGELEHRERMCMVAVTRGLAFDFSKLERPEVIERRIGEILDADVPADRWSAMSYLKAKEARDKAEGKGFAMQIVTAFDTKCPTITKGYAKVRSTDPKLQHPTDPNLLRQFSPAEHARIKGVPERLIDGLSATLAHELLGQSICYRPFWAVGRLIGKMLGAFVDAAAITTPLYRGRAAG